MEDLRRAIEAGAVAGKLRAAARQYRCTADSLDRAADKMSRGAANALAGISAEGPLGVTLGPADGLEMGSFRPADEN